MNEMQLKYGCNPNQKPSRVFMENGDLPFEVICGRPGYINLLVALTAGACKGIEESNRTSCLNFF